MSKEMLELKQGDDVIVYNPMNVKVCLILCPHTQSIEAFLMKYTKSL